MQARFCGECGSELNENGLCPNCSPSEESAPKTAEKDKTQDNTKSNNNKKILLAVLSVVLVFAIIISVGIITTGKRRGERQTATESTDSGNTDQENVQTVYVTYLNEVLIPEWGLLYADGNQANQEGIASVSLTDADKDGTEEMIVLRSKKNGESIENIINCFEFNEQAEKNVEQTGEFIAFSDDTDWQNGYIENDVKAFYSVEHKGRTYYIYERCQGGIFGMDEAHIYCSENGILTEVANIYTDDGSFVYSTKLPPEIKIDNTDISNYIADSEYVAELMNSGKKILFYASYAQDIGVSDILYKKYYQSSDDAVSDFFKHFGIDREKEYIIDGNAARYVYINIPENATLINTYAAWIENGQIKYELNDYSDLKELLKNETTETTTKSFETTTKAPTRPLTAAELEEAEDMVNRSFVFGCIDYNCSDISYEDFVARFCHAFYAGSGIYNTLFGVHESFNPHTTPDPLNIIAQDENAYNCKKLSKEKIDWLAINVYNIPESKVRSANTSALASALITDDFDIAYYYEGYFYVSLEAISWEAGFEVVDSAPLEDGKYVLYVTNWEDYENKTPTAKGEFVVEPKTVDGKKIWSIYSAKIT